MASRAPVLLPLVTFPPANHISQRPILRKPCLAQELSTVPWGLQDPVFGTLTRGYHCLHLPDDTKTFSEAELFRIPQSRAAARPRALQGDSPPPKETLAKRVWGVPDLKLSLVSPASVLPHYPKTPLCWRETWGCLWLEKCAISHQANLMLTFSTPPLRGFARQRGSVLLRGGETEPCHPPGVPRNDEGQC